MTGRESLFFGVSDGYVYRKSATLFSDDGLPITFKLRTRYDTGDSKRTTIKTFRVIVPFGDFPQQTKVLYSCRNREKINDYKTLNMIKEDTESFTINEKGTAISFGFDETSIKKVELEGYELEFDVEKERI